MPNKPAQALLLCLIISFFSLSAQNKKFAKFEKKSFEQAYPFTVMEVIDARQGPTRNIGYYMDGMGQFSPIYLKEGLINEMMNFFATNLPATRDAKTLPLILKINEMEMLEYVDESGHYGVAKSNLTFVTEYQGKYYRLLQTEKLVKGRLQSNSLSKSTDKMVKAFAQCFEELTEAYENPDLFGERVYRDWIDAPYAPSQEKLNFPIMAAPKVEGVYETFEDYLNNTPRDQDGIFVKRKKRKQAAWKGSYEVTPHLKETKKEVQSGWGFCYHDTSYIYHQGSYFPVEINDSSIYFVGYGLPEYSGANGSIAMAGLMGGLAGGLLAAGIVGASGNHSGKKAQTTFHLNPKTGEIILKAEHMGKKGTHSARLVIFRRSKKEVDYPLEITVNDSLLQPFVPYSVSELSFDLPRGPVKICIDKGGVTCRQVVLDPHHTIYFEYSLSQDSFSGDPILIETTKETGKFWTHKAGHFQAKREEVN
ncbi:MAG: hypothetical protein AAFR66_06495 [Bacteroidota bacterium]